MTAHLGLSDVHAPFQVTMPQPLPPCADPDGHFWWDEYHPSRRTHQLIAAAMARAIAAR